MPIANTKKHNISKQINESKNKQENKHSTMGLKWNKNAKSTLHSEIKQPAEVQQIK